MIGRGSRRSRTVQALLVVVAASSLLSAPSASSQEAGLGGIQGTASAYGFKARYIPDGLLPTGAPVDLGVPDALATISSGPATFARASVADPGDVLANPNALIGAADPSAPRVPEYPYRVSAMSGFGEPEARSSPAPGLDARVEVGPNTSLAEGSTPRFDAPAVLTVGSARVRSTTTTDGATVTIRARSEVSDIDLLGVVTIESVVTEVTATSDGTTATSEGGTTITGAEIGGQPIIIDADGVRTDPDAPGGNPITDAVGGLLGLGGSEGGEPIDLLAQAGVEISLVGPRSIESEDSTMLAATGVRIDLTVSDETVPLLTDLIDALPPLENPIPGAPSAEDLIAVVKANNLIALELGGAVVSLAARPTFVPEPFVPEAFAPAAPSTPVSPTSPSRSVSTPATPIATPSLAPSVPTASPSTPATSPASQTTVPAASLSAGIGILALLALLFQPLIGDRLATAAAAILGSDDPGTCPREGQ